jgi:Caspase domain
MAAGRFALIVATSRYSDPTLTQLEAPAHDATSLAAVLGTPAIGGFEVKTLSDRPAPAVMREIEEFFDGRRRDDLVLLYFSGHGILDEGARLYFATADTLVDRPRSTAVPADFVNELMGECRSRRQVLVLDCCNSGAFARGIKAAGSIGTGERFEGRGRVVITASDALQYAFEGERVEGEAIGSVFTRMLVDGLQSGQADLNGDGSVTLDELYDYVYERVLDASPHQRPRKWAFGVEGQIVIAQAAGESAVRPAARAEARPVASDSAAAADGRSRPSGRRRRLRWPVIAGVLALAAIVAVAAVVLATRSTGSPSLAAGRQATVRAYEAWMDGALASLGADEISTSARQALSRMPTEPVTPVPNPDGCYGEPDDVECSYLYPREDIALNFIAQRYPAGPRVTVVTCFRSNSGDDLPIPDCARIVAGS